MQNYQHITDKTDANLGTAFGHVAGSSKGGVYISFRWTQIKLTSADPEKNGKSQRRLMIMKQPVGDTSTGTSSYITPEDAARIFPQEWEYFNKTGDMPMSGTALSELPGISLSQVQMLNLSGLRSVEDLVSINDHIVNQLGHEGRAVREVAEKWMARRKENADLTDFAEEKIAIQNQLAASTKRADDAEAQMKAMMSEMAAMRKMMEQSGFGGQANPAMSQSQDSQPVPGYDSGPDIDDTPNPLAGGDGTLEDDPWDNGE